jgi:hypothetical protein
MATFSASLGMKNGANAKVVMQHRDDGVTLIYLAIYHVHEIYGLVAKTVDLF